MSESGSQVPSKLQHLYHAAPRLQSPDKVDQQVMLAAKSVSGNSADAVRAKKRPPRIGMSLPALAAMCVIGVGVGVLYQSDNKTPDERVAESLQSTPATEPGTFAVTQADAEPVMTQQTAAADDGNSSLEESDSDASGLQIEGGAGTESSGRVSLAPIEVETGDEDLQIADSAVASAERRPSAESTSVESVVEQRKIVADTRARSSAVNKIDGVTTGSDRKVTDLPGNVWLHRQSGGGFTLRLATANSIADRFDTLSEAQQVFDSLPQSGVVSSVQSNTDIVAIGELQKLSE